MHLPNPHKQHPKVSKRAWISETAVIIGNVSIADDVFVGPNAVLRADEPGSSITVQSGSNVQDNVVVHSLSHSEVHIGKNTSLAHGCIVHGPCRIEENCFIGFGAVVFDCNIGKDTLVLHRSVVRGVNISSGKVVPDGSVVTGQGCADTLEGTTKDLNEFKRSVVRANVDLVEGYIRLVEES
ncbi:LbetaH domain-containing protein [Methanosarcina mazei]|jgi:carbonic anhydrase/acetyltransferase-like protein (isoleucine patch superfamily)|uniref:Carbonate dehydratase n=4 Tax=Methanosarcina mazei TaxID=2209 RepID=A0A0F8PGA8_METMZ|nr:carbonate dehydratase [Methanosarcina mazei]AKB65729.1 Carbonic anhydrase, gamma class [Methanosarcina mazei S-6]AKB69127.1 Carbonic anhydrase, gamma class [Methanosarcina mazei LYC]AKB71802.1 Carbonic anhydrase, gamma class [Methanosarcina mazei C16]KKF99230.1 carbonate dehydratase [Methanosarcina mazei]KKG02371.1 carbonate dehydratase [Methanosarcina mazei]